MQICKASSQRSTVLPYWQPLRTLITDVVVADARVIATLRFKLDLSTALTLVTEQWQELIRRWDSERELFLQHRTCRGQRLRPL